MATSGQSPVSERSSDGRAGLPSAGAVGNAEANRARAQSTWASSQARRARDCNRAGERAELAAGGRPLKRDAHSSAMAGHGGRGAGGLAAAPRARGAMTGS